MAVVANQKPDDTLLCVLIDLFHPVVNCFEGFAISHVIHDEDAVSTPVVGVGGGFEAFLSCCVPLTFLLILQFEA